MNITTSRVAQTNTYVSTAKAPTSASEDSANVSDTFTPSKHSRFAENLAEFAGVALAGAAGGAIGSFAPGYWSAPASLLSGAATGAGAAHLTNVLAKDPNPYGPLLTLGGGIWGGVAGLVGGAGANLLESFTGLPRIAAGAIGGAAANVAAYAFAASR